jgi:hypothetical protein
MWNLEQAATTISNHLFVSGAVIDDLNLYAWSYTQLIVGSTLIHYNGCLFLPQTTSSESRANKSTVNATSDDKSEDDLSNRAFETERRSISDDINAASAKDSPSSGFVNEEEVRLRRTVHAHCRLT